MCIDIQSGRLIALTSISCPLDMTAAYLGRYPSEPPGGLPPTAAYHKGFAQQ